MRILEWARQMTDIQMWEWITMKIFYHCTFVNFLKEFSLGLRKRDFSIGYEKVIITYTIYIWIVSTVRSALATIEFFHLLISWKFWIINSLNYCSNCYNQNSSQSSRCRPLPRTKEINKNDRLTEHKQNIVKDISIYKKYLYSVSVVALLVSVVALANTSSQITRTHHNFIIWLVAKKKDK